jgi:L-asparaginase II
LTNALKSRPVARAPSAREPLVVEVRRAGTVESRHLVHAVAVADGEIIASFGQPNLVCFLRSSAKPLQALVLARARTDLDLRDIAIACSSHGASSEQIAAVESLLQKAGADALQLECSAAATAAGRLGHMCSGKHAGMLAACAARGWPTKGYRELGHPLQRSILEAVAEAAGVAVADLVLGVDGCGVPTFALELHRIARSYARLPDAEGGDRITRALRTHPELASSPGEPDLRLMRALPGWIAKAGVEGVLAAAGPSGVGIALKVADGSARALAPACDALLHRLGAEPGEPLAIPLLDSRGDRVGEITAAT